MRALPLCLALLLACARAAGPVPEQLEEHLELANWREIRTPHFTLLTDAPSARAQRMTAHLIAFERVVRQSAPGHHRAPLPAVVLLFRSYGQFLAFSSPGIGGFMSPGLDENLLVSSSDGPAAQTLTHEYVHLLMLGDLAFPPWYDEGFAELLGSVSIREDIATLGGIPPGRRQSLQRGPRVHVEELLGARHSLDLGRRTPGFYAESWLLTHYLYLGPAYGAPQRLDQARALLVLQNRGIPWRAAFEQAFRGIRLDEFQRELDAHRQRILDDTDLPVRDFALGALPAEFEESPVSAAQIAVRLGNLALRLGPRFSELAEAFFRAALAHEADGGAALIGLARCAEARGDHAAADAALERAERSGTEPGRVALARGEILLERRSAVDAAGQAALLADARRQLEKATEISPELPAAWAALGASYVADPSLDPAPGIEALERAHKAVGAHPQVELDLGTLYARSGDLERARPLLSRVAVLASSEETAGKAQALLEGLGAR